MIARLLMIAGIAVGVVALILQFAIGIADSLRIGRSLFGSLIHLFSFFTILANITVVLVYAAALSPAAARLMPFFAKRRTQAAVAVSIALVGIVYATVLAPLEQLEGLSQFCNILLHRVAPVIFVLWWLLAATDGATRWRDIPAWMILPIAYLVYCLVRAPIAGEVPYPFLNVANNGWPAVGLSALTITALFLVLSVVAIAVDHALARIKQPK